MTFSLNMVNQSASQPEVIIKMRGKVISRQIA